MNELPALVIFSLHILQFETNFYSDCILFGKLKLFVIRVLDVLLLFQF